MYDCVLPMHMFLFSNSSNDLPMSSLYGEYAHKCPMRDAVLIMFATFICMILSIFLDCCYLCTSFNGYDYVDLMCSKCFCMLMMHMDFEYTSDLLSSDIHAFKIMEDQYA
jgi:hypothetical protein